MRLAMGLVLGLALSGVAQADTTKIEEDVNRLIAATRLSDARTLYGRDPVVTAYINGVIHGLFTQNKLGAVTGSWCPPEGVVINVDVVFLAIHSDQNGAEDSEYLANFGSLALKGLERMFPCGA
ncbi:hypothetical protein [Rhizobium sp. RAF56]|uniref:hypothetical protein n=1 Tax=Rhizobium sp. RAF56 TaxID=3233062 RepID=UPI003F98AE5D